jgi:hypothetical protein
MAVKWRLGKKNPPTERLLNRWDRLFLIVADHYRLDLLDTRSSSETETISAEERYRAERPTCSGSQVISIFGLDDLYCTLAFKIFLEGSDSTVPDNKRYSASAHSPQ